MSRYDADDTYCYSGTDVLRNKAEITNAEDLEAYEGELSTLRSIEILENPIAGQFDLAHLQRIHLALFQDVYDWAGKIRTVDIRTVIVDYGMLWSPNPSRHLCIA